MLPGESWKKGSMATEQANRISNDFYYTRHEARGAAECLMESCWTMRAARCRTLVEAALPDACAEIYFNLGSGGRHVFTGCATAGVSPRAAWVVGPPALPRTCWASLPAHCVTA
jgi:hypothetical protein